MVTLMEGRSNTAGQIVPLTWVWVANTNPSIGIKCSWARSRDTTESVGTGSRQGAMEILSTQKCVTTYLSNELG